LAKKPGIISRAVIGAWWLVFVAGAIFFTPATEAGRLTYISDLITNSVPGESGSHTITFTTENAVPASGKISFVFEAGGVTNLALLNYLDVDIASASDYTIAAAPSGGTLGVTFTGTGFVIVLGNTPIAGGTTLSVELGSVATYGATGDTELMNGAVTGDYIVDVQTKTASDAVIDESATVFVLVNPVGLAMGPTPTPGGGGGGSQATPSPLVMSIELWPADFATMTPQEFAQTTFADMAALAGMTESEWYAAVLSAYAALPSAAGGVDAVADMSMGEIAQALGVTTTQLYDALNIEDFRYLYTQPSPLGEVTFSTFPDESDADVAALLGLTLNEFYAWLDAQYPAVGSSLMSAVASDLGMTPAAIQSALAAEYPAAASLSGFDSMTAEQVAAALGINLGELYGVLGLTMADVAAVADVSQNALYDALGLDGLTYQSEPPAVFPETEITATVTPGDGSVTLGLNGEPATFITDTMENIGLEDIQSGDWLFTTYAQATDTGGQTSLTGQVWVLGADGEMTLLFERLITSDLSSTLTEYLVLSPQSGYSLEPGDRLVLTYVTETTGGSGEPVTVVVTIGGTEHYSFVQSPPTELTVPPVCFRIADFNGDCRVNITDFSILMANWGSSPRNPLTDINTDGSAGIIDLSILLYWWTG
jgi:hypothetical protein